MGLAVLMFAGLCWADTFPRQDVRLGGIWKFYQGDISGAEQPTFSDVAWDTVCLPHTARLESGRTHSNYNYYIGYYWYRKSFVPDTSYRNKKVFIEFEAAMQSSDVYLNGTKITSYLGGYNPFTVDVTGMLKFDSTNVIAVRCNNTVNTNVSPGNATPDFYYYGGLYRYVNVHVTDLLHITDAVYANKIGGGGVFVTYPSVSTTLATIQVKTNVINEYTDSRTCILKSTLVDSSGIDLANVSSTIVIPGGMDTTFTQSFTVANPRLWNPNTPNLYSVRSEVFDNTRPSDVAKTTIGIRTISFTRAGGFIINGARFYSRGANRHQDYACIGNAVPASGQYRDALKMKEAGINFVRLSHYLQHPSFLDACDKLGILVQASLVGWQYNGFSNTTFVNNSKRDLHTLIRYYRNHPSIIMWESVHNESNPPKVFADSTQAIAHAEFPGNQMYTCGQESNNVMDIYQAAVQQGGRTYSTTKPGAVSEYGHWEYGGYTGTSQQTRASGETGMLQLAKNQAEAMSSDKALSWLSVDAVWVWNDYFGMNGYVNSLCAGGVVDQYRLPKFSYYMYQSQRDPAIIYPKISSGPMVFIANYWTSSSTLSVRVYSNCSQVSLYRNGMLIATQSPDASSATSNLSHPPFTFTVPAFVAGTLHADGLIGGVIKASHEVKTPVVAQKVAVAIDTAGLKLGADGSDLAIVYASIVDSNGTVMPTATNSITFSVTGPGTLITGDGNPLTAVAGIAAVYVKTKYNQPGLITVTASANGLIAGSATVRSMPVSNTTTGIMQPNKITAKVSPQGFTLIHSGNTLKMMLPREAIIGASSAVFRLYTVQGHLIQSWTVPAAVNIQVKSGMLARGIYLGKLTVGGHEFASRIITVRD
jgi:beta-galactosidase